MGAFFTSIVYGIAMALKSTIYKANVQIADIDHGYYADHALTLARHPSETDERMMVRLVALTLEAYKLQSICNGDGTLVFGAGMSDPDEPDVILKDFTGANRLWVEVGQPEDKPVIKACGKSDEVALYAFSHAAPVWWKGIQTKLTRPKNLSVYLIESSAAKELETLAERSMNLQATIQEGALTMSSEKGAVQIEPQRLM